MRKVLGVLMTTLVLSGLGALGSFAAAPARTGGQVYAEAFCTTDPDIILCEDFNYEANFTCVGGNPGTEIWANPAITATEYADCVSRDFPLLTAITGTGAQTLPSGTPNPAGNRVFRANLGAGPASNALTGCFLGDCNRSTGDTPTTYVNGLSAGPTLYVRFQMYRPAGFPWPGNLDNKVAFLYPNRFGSRPDANVDAGLFFQQGTFCSPNTRADALAFRVGSNSGNYKAYPADANIAPYNEHFEYCTGTGAPNGQFGDTTVAHCAAALGACTAAPDPGTLYRWRVNAWQTVEFRYTLSTAGVSNGTIEAWVDGVQVYGDSDLETCGNYGASEGSCYAVHSLQLLNSWHNPNNTSDYTAAQTADCGGGAGSCYSLIDNLIVSRARIGVPSSSSLLDCP